MNSTWSADGPHGSVDRIAIDVPQAAPDAAFCLFVLFFSAAFVVLTHF